MRQAALIFLVFLPTVANASDLPTDIIEAYRSLGEILEVSDDLLSNYQPKATGSVRDAETDLSTVLNGLPFVDVVQVYPAKGKPKRRIVHLANWHAVDADLLTADIEDQLGRKLTDGEQFLYHWRHLAEVETVQAQQMAALRCLMKHHGLKSVFCEGLTSETDRDDLKLAVRVLDASFRRQHGTLVRYAKTVVGSSKEESLDLELMIPQVEREILQQAGSVFRLQRSGLTPEILEDAKTLAESAPEFGKENPFQKEEKREDAIVERLKVAGGGFVLLGGAHDLSDNLKKRDPGCELYVVSVKAYSGIVGNGDE
jgi:hypothetical protein